MPGAVSFESKVLSFSSATPLNASVGATVQPAALPEISAGPADPAAPERYRWNRCIQVRQLDAAVNWDISCSCVSNSSNAAASPATQICKSFQTICH